jgi:GT2 family glycosyltransferase
MMTTPAFPVRADRTPVIGSAGPGADTVNRKARAVVRESVDLAVVVVTYNSESMIGGLLDSLPVALDGLRARVVVVDNGSVDRTREVVSEYPDALLVTSTNRGYAAGVNQGIRAGTPAPAFLVLNPDLRLGPSSVAPLLHALEIPGTGITVPRVVDADGVLDLSLRREPSILRSIGLNWTHLPLFAEYIGPESVYSESRTADWALGAVLAVSADCVEATGEWDESFFLYSEETDFCLRARDRGFLTRLVPGSRVVHIGAQSGESDTIHALHVLNRIRLYRRRHSAPASLFYFVVNVLSEVSWVLRGHSRSWFAVRALLRPGLRPEECGCGDRLLPA